LPHFGLDLVRALHGKVAIAATMGIAFLALAASPALGKFTQGALVSLLVTVAVADIGIVNIGAAFRGLVAGFNQPAASLSLPTRCRSTRCLALQRS
jgi:predicted benzoate:H+ symporter BenE